MHWPTGLREWNRIPDGIRNDVIEFALEREALMPP